MQKKLCKGWALVKLTAKNIPPGQLSSVLIHGNCMAHLWLVDRHRRGWIPIESSEANPVWETFDAWRDSSSRCLYQFCLLPPKSAGLDPQLISNAQPFMSFFALGLPP
jgi:hypothetical protein